MTNPVRKGGPNLLFGAGYLKDSKKFTFKIVLRRNLSSRRIRDLKMNFRKNVSIKQVLGEH